MRNAEQRHELSATHALNAGYVDWNRKWFSRVRENHFRFQSP